MRVQCRISITIERDLKMCQGYKLSVFLGVWREGSSGASRVGMRWRRPVRRGGLWQRLPRIPCDATITGAVVLW
jgi:hypothetical protein